MSCQKCEHSDPMEMSAARIAKRIVAEATLALPPGTEMLPDNKQWTNRFEIHSETSDRVYIIAQHKTKGHWGCSCPAWRTRRKCKHLKSLGLPELEQPHQVTLAAKIVAETLGGPGWFERLGISSLAEFPAKHTDLITILVRENNLGDYVGVSFRGGSDPGDPTIEIIGTSGIVEIDADLTPISSRLVHA